MGVLQRVQVVSHVHKFTPIIELRFVGEQFVRPRETAIVQEEDETPNDRNDRGW